MKLTAVVCVHNEERRLAACLERLTFADEIVVVLDRCTDRSRAIAEHWGAVLVNGVFPLEGPRRAAGVEAASGDWILEIDADERVGPELAQEIQAAMLIEGCCYIKIPIHNYVGDRHIRYGWGGSFGTTLAARLYRRGSKRWGGERVHPTVIFDGPEGPSLHNGLRHQFGESVSCLLRRLDRYTELRAQDMRDHGGKVGVADNARRGVHRFFKCYVRRGGWKEGSWGLLLSVMAGLYPLLSAIRAEVELRATEEPVSLARAA